MLPISSIPTKDVWGMNSHIPCFQRDSWSVPWWMFRHTGPWTSLFYQNRNCFPHFCQEDREGTLRTAGQVPCDYKSIPVCKILEPAWSSMSPLGWLKHRLAHQVEPSSKIICLKSSYSVGSQMSASYENRADPQPWKQRRQWHNLPQNLSLGTDSKTGMHALPTIQSRLRKVQMVGI